MTKLVLDISMSLDGYIAAPDQRPEEPLGAGGEKLHQWAFGTHAEDREVLASAGAATGAVICGRRTYDDSLPWWGADGPTGAARLPVIVVSHDAPDAPDNGVYSFRSGIEEALDAAREAAGGKTVCVMGGADVACQFLNAGLVDEVSIHLVPVLFGGGTRLFENVKAGLENRSATQTPAATHLRFEVVR
jgi:dihydrofolate reductase